MNRDTFRPFPPVTLVMGDSGEQRRINTVQGAAKLLLNHWPANASDEYVTAIGICLDAMLGAASAEVARDALIKVAAEADISVMQ